MSPIDFSKLTKYPPPAPDTLPNPNSFNEAPPAGSLASLVDGDLPEPSPEQERALEILSRADGVIKRLSGKPGTGKSTVIRHLANRVAITICATTAKAALNVGGITLDRLFSYDRTKDDVRNERKLQENMDRCAKIIVVDEASMCGRKMGKFVKRIAKMYDKTLILVGDWAQAKPVKDEWITQSDVLDGSVAVFLIECHRQKDRPFLDALDALGVGCRTHPAYAAFEQCKVNREPEGDHYVRLYATNDMARNYNRMRLAELPDIAPRVAANCTARKNVGPWYDGEEKQLIEDSRFMHDTRLKLGTRLVCTKNEYQLGFVNGDAGELVDIGFLKLPGIDLWPLTDKMLPKVGYAPSEFDGRPILCWLSQFATPALAGLAFSDLTADNMVLMMKHDRTGADLIIPPSTREILDVSDHVMFSTRGFPVLLGWASTIHRAQGATCDNVYVDMASIMHFPAGSRHGLAYVALSRARTLEGLKIFGWNPDAIECDAEVWRLLAPMPGPPGDTP